MNLVTTEVSPLNCSWVTWTAKGPVCTRSGQARPVDEHVCSICEHWTDTVVPASLSGEAPTDTDWTHASEGPDAPTISEVCPNCGADKSTLLKQDVLVRTLRCGVCHQHWLATSPWPSRDDSVK